MPTANSKNTLRRETLNLRIKSQQRGLIDRAAELTGRTRTDFVIDAACRAALDALGDRTLFLVEKASFDKFVAALDAPPSPNAALKRTMGAAPPWGT